jgi:TAP-like protein
VRAPFPSVPTLILSGADDLRTPTANAREVAAQIPGSHLLVVPDVGHSVLGSDLSGCATAALQALFAHKPIKRCSGGGALLALLALAPLAPARLADVTPAQGYRGVTGRALDALTLTLNDFAREAALQALSALATGNLGSLASLRVGGLRAGWGGVIRGALVLHRYSYVPGVTISGRITEKAVVLEVGGSAGARGTIRLGARQTLTGTLDGEPVHLRHRPNATGAIVVADAQASPRVGPGGTAGSAGARSLARLLARLP